MDNLTQFISQNLLLCIVFAVLILAYIIFEAYQVKAQGYYLSVQDAIRISNRDKGVFLDVRDDEAYHHKHIVGAIHLSMDDLKSNNTKFLKKYISTAIILYWTDKVNAKAAYDILIKDGYSKLYVLKGGFKQWCLDKMPVDSKSMSTNVSENKKQDRHKSIEQRKTRGK